MMKTGNALCFQDRQHVLRAYVHRYTGNHKPAWVFRAEKKGKRLPLHFRGDQEWLENTLFHVTKQGRLDLRYHHCESNPTFPNGKEVA